MARTYDEISTALITAMPNKDERESLSDEQIESLRRISNVLDNIAHMEKSRRVQLAQQAAIKAMSVTA